MPTSHGLTLAEEAGDARAEARSHAGLAQTWALQGNQREALACAIKALELSRTLDAPRDIAMGLTTLGWLQARIGQYDDARASCEAALALNRELSQRDAEVETLDCLGYIAHHTGEFHDALSYYREALDLTREIGNTYVETDVLEHIGETHATLDQPAEACRAWHAAADLFRAQHRLARAEEVQRRLLELLQVNSRA